MRGRSTTLLSLLTSFSFLAAAALTACDRNDPVSANRTADGHASATLGVIATSASGADLQITGSSSTGSPFTDSLFTYTFQVKNIGPDEAFNATIVDTLPPTVGFSMVWGTNGTGTPVCVPTLTHTTIVASCNFGTLKKGASATMFVNVIAPGSAGPFSNTVNAVSSVVDPLLANNSVTINTQAQAAKGGKVTTPALVSTIAFTTLPAFSGGGYVFSGGPSGVGFQFIPTISGNMTDLLTATEAWGGGRSEFWIYNDDPNNPDHVGSLYYGPIFGVIPSVFSYTDIAIRSPGLPLVAGQKYWLFGFGSTGELSGLWHYSNDVLSTTPCAMGPFPGIGGYGTCRYPAFDVVVLH